MQSVRRFVLSAMILTAGCVSEAPHTSSSAIDAPECAGTEAGKSCVTLRFIVNDEVRDSTPRRLIGTLNWGLYKGGDVDLLGPGDHPSLHGDEIKEASFVAPNTVYEITVTNVRPQPMQALAYLDTDGDGDSSKGDPVTFPSRPFDVPADKHTVVKVVFDFLR